MRIQLLYKGDYPMKWMLLLIMSFSCLVYADPGSKAELKELLTKFVKEGADYEKLTQKLQPEAEDYEAFFVAEYWEKPLNIAEQVWKNFVVQPEMGSQIFVKEAAIEVLKSGKRVFGFSSRYKYYSEYIRPQHTIYGVLFTGKNNSKYYTSFVYVNKRWVLFPKMYLYLSRRVLSSF